MHGSRRPQGFQPPARDTRFVGSARRAIAIRPAASRALSTVPRALYSRPNDNPPDDPAFAALLRLDPDLRGTVKNLEDISMLDLSSRAVDDQHMMYVSRAKNLAALYMDSALVSDAGLRRISGLEQLMSLDLSNTAIADEQLSTMRCLAGLKCLSLEGTMVGSTRLSWLGRCRSLRYLSLSKTAVTDSDLSGLVECRELETLRIDSTQVSGAFLNHTKSCPQLRYLIANGNRLLTDARVAPLISGNTHLVFLNLSRTDVGDATAARIPRTVKILDLAGTKITDRGVEDLARLESLESLFLSGTTVTDRAVPALLRLRTLKFLYLSGTPVSEYGLRRLRGRIKDILCDQ
jgi:Leucine-rich repeat (LRR) protein